MSKMFIVFVSCKNIPEAKKIALSLLRKKLIACANIVPKIESIYLWKQKLMHENETLLLCKTMNSKITQIKKMVKGLHSYETPCIEFIEIKNQNKECTKWLKTVIR